MPDNRRKRAPGPDGRRPHRFAFGLLIYFVLTLVVFDLVRRYTPRIARRIGGIENGWLQFGIYFVIYVLLALMATVVIRRLPLRLRREGTLRLSFIACATLSFLVAAYQARFGTGMSATYFTVGLLGTFAGALLVTWSYFGLVEVNTPPSPEVVAEVLSAHQGVVVAGDLWDHLKRGIELLLSLVLIVLSLPISVLLAIAVWLQDPGPLLFAKISVTRGGKSFRQLKLRSMVKNAEQTTGTIPAALDDPRITLLGQVLRRTHIDELPQMINIARGEMSLVGPRPERTVFL
ncbi:MAG: sugar transferase [Chloroflexota bacterium]|nr:sugar transferase [Chloroflexota bacterium]